MGDRSGLEKQGPRVGALGPRGCTNTQAARVDLSSAAMPEGQGPQNCLMCAKSPSPRR